MVKFNLWTIYCYHELFSPSTFKQDKHDGIRKYPMLRNYLITANFVFVSMPNSVVSVAVELIHWLFYSYVSFKIVIVDSVSSFPCSNHVVLHSTAIAQSVTKLFDWINPLKQSPWQ